jgi:Family of unknown function (DUF5681)
MSSNEPKGFSPGLPDDELNLETVTEAHSDNETKVGYKRPPVSTRFQPGKSGNPKGRPKAARSMTAIVREQLDSKIEVTIGGRKRRLSARELITKRMLEQALKGDLKAIANIAKFDRTERMDDLEPTSSASSNLTEEERESLQDYLSQYKNLGGGDERESD